MPEYIFDATVLSTFATANRLPLLEARYRGVGFTTIEVSDELRKGVEAGYEHLVHASANPPPVHARQGSPDPGFVLRESPSGVSVGDLAIPSERKLTKDFRRAALGPALEQIKGINSTISSGVTPSSSIRRAACPEALQL